jgi:antitoxin (DNA-binding transcriptional repressor) of toxin-antitoxin stability system
VQYRRDSIVITKAGKPVAALVDMATYERMRRKDSGEFERLWAEFAKGFEDLNEDEAQALADEVLQEARDEIASNKALSLGNSTPKATSADPKA